MYSGRQPGLRHDDLRADVLQQQRHGHDDYQQSRGRLSNSGPTKFATESGVERYVFYVKNKTKQQCNDLALRIWRQISMHEYSIKLVAPITSTALPLMDVTAGLEVYGCPFSAFNQNASTGTSSIAGVPNSQTGGGYWPREIVEAVDTHGGAIWTIDATNHQPPMGGV